MKDNQSRQTSKRKSMNRTIMGIRLDVNDLSEIATMIDNVAKKYGDTVQIRVDSADEEDSIYSTDPIFFKCPEMFRSVSSVSIFFKNYQAPLSISLELVAKYNVGMKISVEGEDAVEVSGTYKELERKLKIKESRLLEVFNKRSMISPLLISLVAGIATYCAFRLVAQIVASKYSIPTNDEVISVINNISLWSLYLGTFFGVFWVFPQFERAFPAVYFLGDISDPSSLKRKNIRYIYGAIVLPFVIKLFDSLVIKSL